MPSPKSNSIIDAGDIKKLLQLLLGNWYVFILCFVVSLVSGYFYSYKLPEIFAAKTQLVMKNDETYPIQQGLYQGLGISGYLGYEKLSNEKRVLTSTDLVTQVISKLKLDVTYYIVGRIQTKEVYAGTPFNVEAKMSAGFYEIPFIFKIKDENNYEISYDVNEKHFVEHHQFGEPVINKLFYILITKEKVLNSSAIATLKDITYQFIVHDQMSLVYKYKTALDVQDLEYTAILEVSMKDQIPERAVMFLDTLSKVYVNNSLKSKVKINENTINYIDNQLAEVTAILDSIEHMLQSYKEKKDILNISKEETEYFSNLSNYEIQKRKLDLQLKSLEYLKNYIVSNMNKELLPPALYMEGEDAYLTQAITQLYGLQVRINNTLFSSTEKSTTVKEVDYKIELLRNDILKYIVNTEKAIHEKISSVEEEIVFYKDLLKGVPKSQREMLNIERKLGVNEKMYLYLLEKRAETVIARAGIISEISIIESAHSVGIVEPDKQKIYYSFMTVGLMIAFFIAFIRMIFFSKIETIEELRELTTLPVLGEIFHSKDAKDSYLIVDAHPRSFVTEAFRSVRTNLEYFAPDVKCKSVLITSNRPGVGKTFCSINLGIILAKGGKKVLLLELDLHKPKIYSALNVASEAGISFLLVGKISPQEAIKTTSVENLDVVVAGPTPPNASELILSQHLADLINYAREHYDYIVIDTPPMGIISDAQTLMKYSDVNLFVLNTKFNPREGMQFAHNAVVNSKLANFVFVLNNVKPKYSRYYSKSYRYAYGYGSGYTQET
ncbi:MAG: polysaccharide biosynthesis tyrosine autokinase [Bacteroidetes bacterium]|nr:polysaccharide biosynthesis tyrosine autokinase [Bacteroidota bacterium]